jgi:hypothetical protein
MLGLSPFVRRNRKLFHAVDRYTRAKKRMRKENVMSEKKRERRQEMPGEKTFDVTIGTGCGPSGEMLFDAAVRETPQSKLESSIAYVRAHALLPVTYLFDGSAGAVIAVEKAAADLERFNADPITRMGAIVLLGHSPCKRAVDALSIFIERGDDFSETAECALNECLSLFVSPYAGVVPESFYIGDLGLSRLSKRRQGD